MGVLDFKRDTTVQDQLPAFLKALAQRESRGWKDPYKALGKKTASGDYAHGKYQVMGAYIPSWTKQYLGKSMTVQEFVNDPQAQEQLMAKRATELYAQHGNWADVASVHFTGHPVKNAGTEVKDVNGTTNGSYIQDIIGNFNKFLGGGTAYADTTQKHYDAGKAPWETQSATKHYDAGKAPWETGGGYQPGAIEKGVGMAASGVGELGKAIVTSTADDFKGLANLPRSIFDPSHPDLAKNIGGSIGAGFDIAIIAGGILGTPFTLGGSDVAAAGMLAAKEGGELAVKSFGKKVLEKTTSTVGLSAGNAASSFAKAKGEGASTGQALEAGATSFGETLLTLGAINKFGPKVSNAFMNVVGKSKIAEYASTQFQKATDVLKNASLSGTLGEGADAAKSAINYAATSIARGAYSLFSKVATSLPEPGENAVGTMADNSFRITNAGSEAIDRQYGAASEKLAQYDIPKTVAGTIEKAIGSVQAPTTNEIQQMVADEATRMISAGETAGMTAEDISRQAKATVDASLKATTQAAESVTEGAQMLANTLKSGAKVTAAEAYRVINQIPEEVKGSIVVDRIQKAIQDALSKTPEGKALWSELRALSNRRAENQAQREFSSILSNTKGAGWRSAVDAVYGMLKNSGDVGNLLKALGFTSKQFQDMLTKRIYESTSLAYKTVLDNAPNHVVTPKVLDEAQKAATGVLDKYLNKLSQLPGLLPPEREHVLYGMRNVIPNMETVAKNAGVDMSFAEGKQALKIATDKQTLDIVQGTDWYKAVVDPAKFTEAPAALFRATVPEIQSIKKMLGADSEEWKAVGASALAHIWNTVRGLWGETDVKTIEDTLDTLSAKVGGNKELFSELFDTAGKGGKNVRGGQILDDIVNYGNLLKKGLSEKQRGGITAITAIGAHLVGHPFMAINEGRKAIGLLADDEVSLIESVASKSKPALRKEISDALKSGTMPPNIQRYFDIIKRTAGTLIKYEVSKKVIETTNGIGQQGATGDQQTPPTQ